MLFSGGLFRADRMSKGGLLITVLFSLLFYTTIASEVPGLEAVLSDCTILSTDGSVPFHIEHQYHRERNDGAIECITIRDLTEDRNILSFKVFSGRRGIIERISEAGRWKARVTRPHGSRYFTTQIVPGLFIPLNSGSVIIFAMAANIHLTDFHLDSCLDYVNAVIKTSRNASHIPANFFSKPNREVCDGIVLALSMGVGNQSSQFLKSPKLKRPSSKKKPRTLVWMEGYKKDKESIARQADSSQKSTRQSKFSIEFINNEEPSDHSDPAECHADSPSIGRKGSLRHILNHESRDVFSDYCSI